LTNHHQYLSFSLVQSCSRKRLRPRRRIWTHKSDQTSWCCWTLAEGTRTRLTAPLLH